jgi:hypothetical protein
MLKPEHTPHGIELNLRGIGQLFNAMNPVPFPGKDLNGGAEEFLLSGMPEFPLDEPVVLVVHPSEFPAARIRSLSLHRTGTIISPIGATQPVGVSAAAKEGQQSLPSEFCFRRLV